MERNFCRVYARLCAKLNSESNNIMKKFIHTEFMNGIYTILCDGSDKKEDFLPKSEDEKEREKEVNDRALDLYSFRRIILSVCQNVYYNNIIGIFKRNNI